MLWVFEVEVLVQEEQDIESEGLLSEGREGVELQYLAALEMAIF